MNDKISVIINSILQPPSQANINQVKSSIKQALGNVNINQGIQLLNKKEINDYLQTWNNAIDRLKVGKDKIFADPRVTQELTKMKDVMIDFQQGSASVKDVSLQMDNLRTRVTQVGGEFRNVTRDGYSFVEMITLATKKIAIWAIGTTLIYGSLKRIRQGISIIVELDASITKLRKVTNETAETYREFGKTAGQIGLQLGKTRKEVIDSATEFARLGYSIEQAGILAREAMLFSNVGLMSIEQATTSMISIVKGFGIVVDEQGRNVRRIVDIVNEVGNNFAISQAGISEALRRSAASLANSGNTIEESVAILTAANAVIQNPEMVGKLCPLAA